jgi:hypothetical protein
LVYRIGVRVGYGLPRFPQGIEADGNQQKEEHAASVGYDVIPFEPASEYPGLRGFERAPKADYRRTADEPLRNRLRGTARYERGDGEYQRMAREMERAPGMELVLQRGPQRQDGNPREPKVWPRLAPFLASDVKEIIRFRTDRPGWRGSRQAKETAAFKGQSVAYFASWSSPAQGFGYRGCSEPGSRLWPPASRLT